MDNQDNNRSLFDLSFDANVKQTLKGAAQWGGIAAILMIAGTVLSLIGYFVEQAKPRPYMDEGFERELYQASQTSGLIFLVIISIIYGFLFYYLYQFSKVTRTGIDTDNQDMIGQGLGNLATYLKIIGVLVIIGITLFVLFFLFAIASNASDAI